VPTYAHNAGAINLLKYHLVCCPNYQRPGMTDAVADRLKFLLADRVAELRATLYALEVMSDHVHLFRPPMLRSRAYFVATVMHVSDKSTQRYVEKQWERTGA
jgi:putative transposase